MMLTVFICFNLTWWQTLLCLKYSPNIHSAQASIATYLEGKGLLNSSSDVLSACLYHWRRVSQAFGWNSKSKALLYGIIITSRQSFVQTLASVMDVLLAQKDDRCYQTKNIPKLSPTVSTSAVWWCCQRGVTFSISRDFLIKSTKETLLSADGAGCHIWITLWHWFN